jgi:aldehyde dehydrogenase (NAD+)
MQSFDPDKVEIKPAHYINGQYLQQGRSFIDVSRPSDGEYYASLPIADADTVDQAVEGAWQAQKNSAWAKSPPRERLRTLYRWAELIEADTEVLARIEALGSTRPIADVLAWDIPYIADTIRFFAEFADKHGGEVAATQSDRFGMTVSEPYGVIGAITPWNFPLVMAVWKVAPALAAGNAVVLKPSEMTPFSSARLAELAVAAGVPPGLFNVVQGDGQTTGTSLCSHPKIAKVTFTGSTRTGASIMSLCANTGIKPVTLELGGKSPQIVFADAPDLDKVAAMVARAITGNAGQVCVAGSRLLVEESVAEQLATRVGQLFGEHRPGLTWEQGGNLSPIISQPQADRIAQLVDEAQAQGARVVTGGKTVRLGKGGAFYLPTLLGNIDNSHNIIREEIFGPVLTMQTFRTEQQAFELATHPTYGLAAGVHTADLSRAMRAIRAIEAGTIWINRYGRSSDHIMPTGGFKQSGIGKDLGRQAYEANLRSKSVLIDIGAASE